MNIKKQLGQGMTEYIIIVALIAIAAIAVYNIFGDQVRGQVGNMASELGGKKGSFESGQKSDSANQAGSQNKGLDSFGSSQGK